MERFRKKCIILPGMPDSLVLDVAHNMVKDADQHWFPSHRLTFYMGDIAYDKLIKHIELTVTSETKHEKLFGIEIKRLSSMAINSGTLILESNVPTIDANSLYTGSIIRSISYDEMFRYKTSLKFNIEKVIFNDPATIILWKDGTKTVVQAQGEDFDPEKGMAMAIAKKALGNQGNYYDIFKEWLPEEEEEINLQLHDEFYNPFEGFSNIFKMEDCEIEINPKEIKKGNKDAD